MQVSRDSRTERFPVAMEAESHPFPSRTRKLSPPSPMVLGGQPPGRVGRRRNTPDRQGPRSPRGPCSRPGYSEAMATPPGSSRRARPSGGRPGGRSAPQPQRREGEGRRQPPPAAAGQQARGGGQKATGRSRSGGRAGDLVGGAAPRKAKRVPGGNGPPGSYGNRPPRGGEKRGGRRAAGPDETGSRASAAVGRQGAPRTGRTPAARGRAPASGRGRREAAGRAPEHPDGPRTWGSVARRGARVIGEPATGSAADAWRRAIARARTGEDDTVQHDAPQWQPEVWVREDDEPPARHGAGGGERVPQRRDGIPTRPGESP